MTCCMLVVDAPLFTIAAAPVEIPLCMAWKTPSLSFETE